MSGRWAPWADAVRPEVEAALEAVLPAPDDDDDAAELARAMRHAVLSGGKRLRPLLCLLACETVSAESPAEAHRRAMPAAVALELLHTYSLVHDDLPSMDDDDLRRGVPTCHIVFGEATAVLAGDALHTLAFQSLAAEGTDPALTGLWTAELAAGARGMVEGQVADMAAEGYRAGLDPQADLRTLEGIHRRKTAALLTAAVRMGARAGGAAPDALEALTAYGRHVGLAFQVADDCLDETQDSVTLGKTAGKDRAAGKLTYPALLGLEAARARARELAEEAVGALSAVDADVERLAELARHVVTRAA